MTLPVNEPQNEIAVCCQSVSIGASPVASSVSAPVRGRIVRTYCMVGGSGTTTGSGTVAVSTTASGSSDIGALTLPIGAAQTGTSDAPTVATRAVNEGDYITFTPASGGGANVVGTFVAVIRK